MKFKLSKFFEFRGKSYDVSYAIDAYMNGERYKHGVYGEICPIANEYDTEDWLTIHKDLGEDRIFKFTIIKEENEYFVEIDHPVAIELLQSGDCKFSKRSFIDESGDEPKFTIITLDIVLNEVELSKYVSFVKYKLDRVKLGNWFDNRVTLEYFIIYDKNIIGYNDIETKEFVKLSINEICVFIGELKSLLYGGIVKPKVFEQFLLFLNEKGTDVEIDHDIIETHCTENSISWWRTPERLLKKLYEYECLELKTNIYGTSNKFNLEIFTSDSKYTQYFVLYSKENGHVIKYFNKLKHTLDYIRENCKISFQEYTKISKDIKDLDLKNIEENNLDIIPFLKGDTYNIIDNINTLSMYLDKIPNQESGIVRYSSGDLDSNLIFYYKNTPINSFKVIGKEEQYEKCIYIGVYKSNHQNYILASEDFSKVFVEIPIRKVLKERFDINVVYDKDRNTCDILGNDEELSLEKCKRIFTPLYDEEDKCLHICVDIKDKNILDILPTSSMDHLYVKYGNYIQNIENICKQFLENVELNTKIFNSIDKKELGEYFGLYEDGILSEKNNSILNELIKIRGYILNK